MQNLPFLLETLREYWTTGLSGLTRGPHEIRAGATPEALAEFEGRFQVKLPDDFRAYLSTVNGMGRHDWDGDTTSWWGLDRIRPIGEHYAHVSSHPDSQRDFVICDFLMDCLWYAIRLRGEAPELGEILIWADERPLVVARSFAEFLETYLANPGSLGRLPQIE